LQDLNDLYLFSAVVTHRGFSAAARALKLPKSQLSKRVARLEDRLGVRLLERTTRAMRVTEIGQAFFERCEAVLSGVEAAEAVVAEALAEPRGVVRISCPPALARSLLARALPGFAARHPRVRVLVRVLNRPVDLIEDNIDIALRARSKLDDDPDLMMRVLGRGPNFLVASPEFIAEHGPLEPAALSLLPTLSPSEGDGQEMWRLVGPKSQTAEIPIQARIACNDFDVILAAACAGLGVALLPGFIAEAPLASGTLRPALPGWTAPEVTVHLVFSTRRGLSPAVRALIDHLAAARSVLRGLINAPPGRRQEHLF